ncbi:MAG: maleylpyruvate isomerase N-terminal domain-containing protein [Longimicrobiales bacterium]|nr:maleylpyruvate isomerase N-terminal domain-containing protein [Longimicrobiales bacterium]
MTLPVAEAAIADAQEARHQLLELVDSLAEADWSRPVPYGEWTVKDLVAHVIGDLTGGFVGMLVSGQLDPRLIPQLAQTYDPRPINTQQVAARKGASIQELRELLDRSLEPHFAATRQARPEHLHWPIPLGPGYEIATEDMLWSGYHDRTHADDIRRALRIDWRPEPLHFLPQIEEKLFWMQRCRDGLLTAVYSVADDAWDEPGALPSWTHKDVLAHVAANDLRAHTRLRAALCQRDEAELAALRDVDAWNDRSVQERRERSVRELVDEMLALRHQTLRLLSRLREEHTAATVTTTRGEMPVPDYIHWVAVHEAEHAGHLVPASRARRWRAQHPESA